MISERQQIRRAVPQRSEGGAARIIVKKERDLLEIEIRSLQTRAGDRRRSGRQSNRDYASAYNQAEDSIAFYEFQSRPWKRNQEMIGGDTKLNHENDGQPTFSNSLKNGEP